MYLPFKMFVTYPIYHAIERAIFTSRSFEKTWSALSPKLEHGVELVAGEIHPRGPALIRKYLYQEPAMRRIIRECMKDMFSTEIMVLLTSVQRVRKDIAKREKEILGWEKDMIAAPKKSWNPFDFSQSKLKGKIQAARTRINVDNERIEQHIDKALRILEKRSIRMTREQIESLLFSAEGEDIASIMAVADTVKQIFFRLEKQLAEENPSAELSKTYAGFYMMGCRIYLEAIDMAIHKIDRKYLKGLERIQNGTMQQVDKATAHMKHYYANDHHIETLKTNIAINQRTLQAAQFYARNLRNRSKDLLELRVRAKHNYEVSLNTFLTMKMGADLVDIIRSSQTDLARIFEFELPKISELCSSGFSDQYRAITEEIKRR
jgi:hypothetical protein